MGELGRRAVGGHRVTLARELTRAYADEWFAHYNFQFAANVLWGHHSPSLVALLSRKSAEAFARTNRLAQRILQIGEQPGSKISPDHAGLLDGGGSSSTR